jgi:hypothetical protein
MKSTGRPGAFACCITLAILAGQACPVRADNVEYRRYVIYVDDKQAGWSRLTMVDKPGDTTHVTGEAEVNVKLLFLNAFSYKVRSEETWEKGELKELKSDATEDGKNTQVEVKRAGEQLQLRVNGAAVGTVRSDSWTSSYWKLADGRFHNKQVPLLDADTGKFFMAKLDFVGTEAIKIGNVAEDCYHFRVTGLPVPIDLWFDRHHRMVRQDFTEKGHRTIVQLIEVKR